MNINKYIKINFSFIIFLLVSLFSGLILKSTLFIICLIVHEIGHILLIKLFNQKLSLIEITGFGMIISTHFEIHPLKKGLIYLGGLLFSFLLEVIFFIMNQETLLKINLLIIIINLIPIPPLDGFNIIVSLLELFYDEEFSLDIVLDISIIFIVLLSITFLLTKLYFLLFLITFSIIRIIKYKSEKKIIYLKKYIKFNRYKQIPV